MTTVGVQALACFARLPGLFGEETNPALEQPKGWTPTFLLLFILAHSSTSGLLAADLPRVPPGFTITRVTTPEQVQHPLMACFDDRGRLYVCESAGLNAKAADLLKDPQDKIVRLEDADGDGTFDKSVTFADKLVFPQGVLWHEGVIYTCSSPYLWKLEDTDGDGVCDKRTVLVKSFGFSGNAADIHGPFLGPEGRLWWCDGRHGHEIRTDDKGLAGGPNNAVEIPPKPEPGLPNPDGQLLSKGKAARIFNCKLDGTDVQTFCGGGMDNPVEIDFWDTGEVIGTVNLFHGTPRGDCLVHWVWGGVYPRTDQQDCIAEFPRTVGPLDEIINYGHVAVSGMCKYRGDQFGKGWDQSVFITLFNTHKVIRTTLERSGSTFKATATEDFVTFDDPDSHPTDVLEDADGSLLVIDTGGWFRIGCPASQVAKPQIGGAIYRVRKAGAHSVSDPRGEQLALGSMTLGQILDLQGDPRPVVVAKALAELRRRDRAAAASGLSLRIRELNEVQLRKFDAMARRGFVAYPYWTDVPWQIEKRLIEDCVSPDLAERRVAVEAVTKRHLMTNIGRFGAVAENSESGSLIHALEHEPVDRVLEHVVTHGLMQDRSWAGGTTQFLKNSHPKVQKAALIAAEQRDQIESVEPRLQRDQVVALLSTSDADLQRTVFDVISRREGWAAGVVDLIGQWLGESSLSEDRRAIIRRFLAARASEPSVQNLVATRLNSTDLPADSRRTLLESIIDAKVDPIPAAWSPGLQQSLTMDAPTQRLVIAAALRHKIGALIPGLEALIESETNPPDLRVAAMEVIHVRDQQPLSDRRFQLLKTQLDNDSDPLLRSTAARILADSPLSQDQLLAITRILDARHAILAPTLVRAFTGKSDEALGKALITQLQSAADSVTIPAPDLARVLKSFPASIQSQAAPLLAGLDPAKQAAKLAELTEATRTGNPKAGREVFFSNKALCSRCHRVNNQGETIGPDLSMVGAIRQHHELVEAVIEPSASFVRSYRPVILATSDGKVHTGVISSESSTEITLRTADFNELRVPRADIETFKESDTSIMPAGVDQRLTRTELADLIAFLASLKERKP